MKTFAEVMPTFNTALGEVFYIIIGIIFILVGIKALRDKELGVRYFTAAFWFILAFTFILGPYFPSWVTGVCILVIAALSGLKKIKVSKSDQPSTEQAEKHASKLGMKVFIPTVVLAVVAVCVATWTGVGANNAIGISSVVALIVALLLTKAPAKYIVKDGTRIMDDIGAVGIFPQLLAALGALFTAAGVGDVIAKGVSFIIPEGNMIVAVIVYCLAMFLFTFIMGNGFASFSVITVGIAIPFLLAKGADPTITCAVGITAGYCGTMCTPMAANFNIMPAALLQMKDSKYGIIKAQLVPALCLLVFHMAVICVFAL